MITIIKTSIYVLLLWNMAGIGWHNSMNVYGQESLSKQFLIVNTAALQIFSDSASSAASVSDFIRKDEAQDTLEIIGTSKNFYNVRYFSTNSFISEGFVQKNKNQKVFELKPIYSLSERKFRRTNVPAREDRIKVVKSHAEWSEPFRFITADGFIATGMSAEIVRSCYGDPDERLRFFTSLVNSDQWLYYLSPELDFRITFQDNKLVLFEDRTLHSWAAAEQKMIEDKQSFFYPHRMFGMKIMVGGVICLAMGYNGLKHQSILSSNDAGIGNPRVVSSSNAVNWAIIGLGFAAESLGGYLFNYSPDVKLIITPSSANLHNLSPPMAGISISF